MNDKENRDADAEFVLESLMVKCFHAHPRSKATTYGCEAEECGFRYAPSPVLRFPFVEAVNAESEKIDG